MFVLENIIEKFPETRAVLDDEFISETQALYDNMSESVLTRLAEAERTLENARNGIFEDHITLDDLGITIEGYS